MALTRPRPAVRRRRMGSDDAIWDGSERALSGIEKGAIRVLAGVGREVFGVFILLVVLCP